MRASAGSHAQYRSAGGSRRPTQWPRFKRRRHDYEPISRQNTREPFLSSGRRPHAGTADVGHMPRFAGAALDAGLAGAGAAARRRAPANDGLHCLLVGAMAPGFSSPLPPRFIVLFNTVSLFLSGLNAPSDVSHIESMSDMPI